MIGIDMKTVVFINVVSSIFFALMLFVTWRTLSNEKGLQEWALGSIFAAVASCLQILRGEIPDFFSIIISNVFFILAVGYFYIGSRLLWGLPKGRPWHWIGSGALFLTASYYTYIEPNLQMRICIVSTVSAGYFWGSGYLFLRNIMPDMKLPQIFAASIFLVESLALVIRAVFALVVQDGQDYFHSTTLVNVSAGFIILIFDLCMPVSIALLISARLQAKMKIITHQDELTGIANRRYFNEVLKHEWEVFRRQETPLSIISIDVDHFKKFNDCYGHPTGDACLQKISKALKESVGRPKDLVARYGGEEFIILLPETDSKGAEQVAEKIKKSIKNLDIAHSTSPVAGQVTVSMGVVCVMSNTYQEEDLLKAVDNCLYKAKNAGRNRIESLILQAGCDGKMVNSR